MAIVHEHEPVFGVILDDPPGASELPSWAALCRFEPRLLELQGTAIIGRRGPRRLRWRRYSAIKRQLSKLVGWHAFRSELRTSEAYDIAHKQVLGAW